MPIQKKVHIKSLFLMHAVFKKLNPSSTPHVVPNRAFIFWAEREEKLKEKKKPKDIEETFHYRRTGKRMDYMS